MLQLGVTTDYRGERRESRIRSVGLNGASIKLPFINRSKTGQGLVAGSWGQVQMLYFSRVISETAY